jgi:hypothetical protein
MCETNDKDILTRIQKRIDAEDTLLHARTTNFLVLNGLLLAGLGIKTYEEFHFVFISIGILVSFIWIFIGWQSWKIIRQWHIEREKAFPNAIEVQVAKTALLKPGPFRPTDLVAKWLPLIFLGSWIFAGTTMIMKLLTR